MVTCALWDIESRELDRRPLGPLALKTTHIEELRREFVCPTQHKKYTNCPTKIEQ